MKFESFSSKISKSVNPLIDFADGVFDGVVQSPWNAVSHLVGGHLGTMELVDDRPSNIFGQAGEIAGAAVGFAVVSRLTGLGTNPLIRPLPLAANGWASSALKMGISGMVWGIAFNSSDDGEGLLKGRSENALINGLTFATMGGVSSVLEQGGALNVQMLKGKILSSALAGGVSGVVNAFVSGEIKRHELPSAYDVIGQTVNYATFGAVFGAFDAAIGKAKDQYYQANDARAIKRIWSDLPKSVQDLIYRLPQERLSNLQTRRVSGKTADDWAQIESEWVPLYKKEFPLDEQQPIEEIRAHLQAGDMKLFLTKDKTTGRTVAFSLYENYRPTVGTHERPFLLSMFRATERDAQGSGIGTVHMQLAMNKLKLEHPSYMGIIGEIEATSNPDGSCKPPDSQPVKRFRFYERNGRLPVRSMKSGELAPYELPAYQPVDAQEYVMQKDIPAATRSPVCPDGLGTVQAELNYFPFDLRSQLDGNALRSVIGRIINLGYSVRKEDPYYQERLSLIDPTDNYYNPPSGMWSWHIPDRWRLPNIAPAAASTLSDRMTWSESVHILQIPLR